MTTTGLLDGIRVIDLTRVLAGPYCTMMLGDLGADVIKIEAPGLGDDTRQWGPPFTQTADGRRGEAAYFLAANRNKRSLTLNLKMGKGLEILRELIRQEGLEVTDEQVNAEIDRIAERFGEQAAAFRGIYETGAMRDNLRSDLLYRQMTERVAAIAKGEAPEKPEPTAETTLVDETSTDEGEAS